MHLSAERASERAADRLDVSQWRAQPKLQSAHPSPPPSLGRNLSLVVWPSGEFNVLRARTLFCWRGPKWSQSARRATSDERRETGGAKARTSQICRRAYCSKRRRRHLATLRARRRPQTKCSAARSLARSAQLRLLEYESRSRPSICQPASGAARRKARVQSLIPIIVLAALASARRGRKGGAVCATS